MGNPVEGVVGTGASSTAVAPILLGGVDGDGICRTLLVDADGVVQTSAAATPSLAAVLVVGNSAGTKKITNVVDPTSNQDAATKKYIDDAIAALLAALPTVNPGAGAVWNDGGAITNGTA